METVPIAYHVHNQYYKVQHNIIIEININKHSRYGGWRCVSLRRTGIRWEVRWKNWVQFRIGYYIKITALNYASTAAAAVDWPHNI